MQQVNTSQSGSDDDNGEADDVDESNADADEKQSVLTMNTEKQMQGQPSMKVFGSENNQLHRDKNKNNQSCNLSYDSDASDNEITRQNQVKNINMSPNKHTLVKPQSILSNNAPSVVSSKQSKKSKVIVISLNDLNKE